MKNKKTKGFFFGWFMGLMGKRLPIYLFAIFLSSVGMAVARVALAWISEIIVSAAQKGDATGVLLKVVLAFGLYVFSQFMWRTGIVRYNIEAKHGIAKVEKMIFSKAMRLPMSYYEEHHSGDFISRLTFDTERAGDIYGSRLRRLSSAVISAIVYFIPMFYYSPQLTLCLLAVSLLSFVVNSLFLKPMKEAGSKLAGKNSTMTENLTNILAGMEVAKMFPVGKRMLKDYQDSNKEYSDIQKKTNRLNAGLESLNVMFDLLGALAFLGLGVWFVSKDMVSVGALTAIYTLYGSFRWVFLEIGRYLPQMMNCLANVERLYEFLELEEEPEQYVLGKAAVVSDEGALPVGNEGESTSSAAEKYAVIVDNLFFSYNEERPILQNISFKVEKGKCFALVGESGCGKSTLAKLLLGFYKPKSGDIYILGKNRSNSTLWEMRELISYVPQEPYLYDVSIAENIAYGRSNVSPEEVPMEDIIAAAKAANAHEFIMKLPEGYQTIPGERGTKLSGGERQRIAIARAVLRNAPILLLDEATSALDNESERLVNEAINRISKERTTIMIAHRQSTIAMADEVFRLTNSLCGQTPETKRFDG